VFCLLFNVSELTEKKLLKRYKGWYLLKGLFRDDSKEKNILEGINKVLAGEYWLPRSFMQSFLEKNNPLQDTTESTAVIHDTLTPKEVEILSSICNGMSNTEVANYLHISKHTVKAHVYNIFRKLNVKNRLQAANWYQEQCQ
jgi:LuxR family transcriptional regulator of csgAB operon